MYHCTIGEQGNGFTACSKPLLIVKALPLVRVFVFEMFVPGIRELQLISVMSSLMTWGLAWWCSLLAAVVFVLLTDVSAVQEDIWTIIITTCWHHSKILNTVSHKVIGFGEFRFHSRLSVFISSFNFISATCSW